jgi:hypothetical protein
MLPLSIEKRISQPGILERQFLNYLRMANAPIDQSKSIAYEVLYHTVETTNRNNVEFFTGQLDQAFTNIRGSFVRPQSEHFLIYGLRGYREDGTVEQPFTPASNVPLTKGFTSQSAYADVTMSPYSNATLSIQVNSIRMARKIPLLEFDNEMVNTQKGTMLLDQPILWEGQTELKLSVQTNDPANVFTAQPPIPEFKSYMRFDLLGIGLI